LIIVFLFVYLAFSAVTPV